MLMGEDGEDVPGLKGRYDLKNGSIGLDGRGILGFNEETREGPLFDFSLGHSNQVIVFALYNRSNLGGMNRFLLKQDAARQFPNVEVA
jgi:hypothetical protein